MEFRVAVNPFEFPYVVFSLPTAKFELFIPVILLKFPLTMLLSPTINDPFPAALLKSPVTEFYPLIFPRMEFRVAVNSFEFPYVVFLLPTSKFELPTRKFLSPLIKFCLPREALLLPRIAFKLTWVIILPPLMKFTGVFCPWAESCGRKALFWKIGWFWSGTELVAALLEITFAPPKREGILGAICCGPAKKGECSALGKMIAAVAA